MLSQPCSHLVLYLAPSAASALPYLATIIPKPYGNRNITRPSMQPLEACFLAHNKAGGHRSGDQRVWLERLEHGPGWLLETRLLT